MIGFPFDSHVTYDAEGNPIFDRAISSAPYRKLLKELFKTGIMPTNSENFQVAAGEGMSVIVRPGFAMVEGCMKLEEEITNLPLQASDSTLDRIDTVVLRLDSNEAVRSCEFAIVQGAGSLVPTRPELTRNESVYEIGLADILVSKNVSIISDSKITDTRYDTERCGVVSSVSEFDTTTLNQQMVAWSREQREEFVAWVDSIKDILDESTAGHLQNEIDELKESAGGVKGLIGGEYSASKTYNFGDVVAYEGSMWKSKLNNNAGNTPAEGTYWTASDIATEVSNMGGVRLGFDGDGNGGYYKADGSFAPFSNKDIQAMQLPHILQGFSANSEFNYTLLEDYDYVIGIMSNDTGGSLKINGIESEYLAKCSSSSNRVAFKYVKNVKKGDALYFKASAYNRNAVMAIKLPIPQELNYEIIYNNTGRQKVTLNKDYEFILATDGFTYYSNLTYGDGTDIEPSRLIYAVCSYDTNVRPSVVVLKKPQKGESIQNIQNNTGVGVLAVGFYK